MIGLFSVLLSRAWGIWGLPLPPALVVFVYMWIDSLIAEFIAWDEERNQ